MLNKNLSTFQWPIQEFFEGIQQRSVKKYEELCGNMDAVLEKLKKFMANLKEKIVFDIYWSL